MLNMKVLKIVGAFAGAVVSGSVFANSAPVDMCGEFNWKPGYVIHAEAPMYEHVSIQLPEDSMDVVWAAKGLWEIEYVKNFIFAKPLTEQPQGAETTVTAVGQSGNAYQIKLRRTAHPQNQCITVSTAGGMINRTAWQSAGGDASQGAQIQALTAQVARLNAEKAEAARDGDRKAREAIRMYRSAINTNYEWTNAEGWYAAGGDVVESVHDDGRFTYVKLKSDNRGLMTIQAEIDGKKEILESTYDASTRTHKISGIFPKFVMRAGDSELTIIRKGV